MSSKQFCYFLLPRTKNKKKVIFVHEAIKPHLHKWKLNESLLQITEKGSFTYIWAFLNVDYTFSYERNFNGNFMPALLNFLRLHKRLKGTNLFSNQTVLKSLWVLLTGQKVIQRLNINIFYAEPYISIFISLKSHV